MLNEILILATKTTESIAEGPIGTKIVYALTCINTAFLIAVWWGQKRIAKNQKKLSQLMQKEKGD